MPLVGEPWRSPPGSPSSSAPGAVVVVVEPGAVVVVVAGAVVVVVSGDPYGSVVVVTGAVVVVVWPGTVVATGVSATDRQPTHGAVSPPLVTVSVRTPGVAVGATVSVTLSWVALTSATPVTVTSAPPLTVGVPL